MKINKIFINTTFGCNMDCPRCYIPKKLRDDVKSRLDLKYLKRTLEHKNIGTDANTVAMYMGGEPSIIGKKQLEAYINTTNSVLPNARHTIVTNLFNLPSWLVEMSINQFERQIETTYANGKKQTLDGNETRYQEKFIENLTTIIQAGVNCTVNVELNIETVKAGIEPIINIMKRSQSKDWAFDYSVNFDEFNLNPVFDSFNYPELQGNATLRDYWNFVNAIKNNKWVVDNEVRIAPRLDGFNVFILEDCKSFLTINPNNTVTTNPLFSTMKPLQYPDIDALNNSDVMKLHGIRAIARAQPCQGCNELTDCRSFSAHVPIEEYGICAGGLVGGLDGV